MPTSKQICSKRTARPFKLNFLLLSGIAFNMMSGTFDFGLGNVFHVHVSALGLNSRNSRSKKNILHRPSMSSSSSIQPSQSQGKRNKKTRFPFVSSSSTFTPTTSTAIHLSTYGSDDKQQNLQRLLRLPLSANVRSKLEVSIIISSIVTVLYNLLSNHNIRQAINTFFVNSPYIAAFIICACKASIADFVVQKSTSSAQKKGDNNSSNAAANVKGTLSSKSKNASPSSPSFEYKRNLAFFFYGGAYQGCVQEHIFNHIYPKLFGNGIDIRTVGVKVLVDMLILTPFLCLPIAYIIKGAIYKNTVVSSIKRYILDVKDENLLGKYWFVWGPTQCVTFSIIPEQYRITFIAFISFFWLLILSSISGKKVKVE